ncbi:acetylxylan esterase [Tenacibaculum sp. S7007]|uniref:Acetylxylan esterase n=1 Tax=Tenacibaculum pelagium TaxID=2759527 RepID=A0A839ASA4_9FLAO|nr:acetylxylan esterase [Tenacibaculum pelagium]
MENTPKYLDRISLNAIHDSIINIANNNPKINNTKIAVIGGSKGGELVLNLASHYNDIDAVIAIVPSHANFPSTTVNASTSSWSLKDKELPFIPMPWKAVPSVLKREMSNAYKIMLENKVAEDKASIAVEKINGNLLLISATQDELWPSTLMSNKIINRLKVNNFNNYYEHIPIEGGHTEPLKHFDKVFQFLEEHFKTN